MMREVEFADMRETVEALADPSEWHYHYLAPDCSFNDGDQHRIVLEVSGARALYCDYAEKPVKRLRWLGKYE